MLSYIVVRAINCKICFESISIELTPRLVSEAFYNGEVEAELRTLASEMKLPIEESVFHTDSDRELVMEKIECIRSTSIYVHNQCTPACRERGMYHEWLYQCITAF